MNAQDFVTLAANMKNTLGSYAKFVVEHSAEGPESTFIRVTPKDIAMRRVVLDALISMIYTQTSFDLLICSKTKDFLIMGNKD